MSIHVLLCHDLLLIRQFHQLLNCYFDQSNPINTNFLPIYHHQRTDWQVGHFRGDLTWPLGRFPLHTGMIHQQFLRCQLLCCQFIQCYLLPCFTHWPPRWCDCNIKLEQLECLLSEIPPAAPWLPILVIHIRSQVKTRQSQSYKF